MKSYLLLGGFCGFLAVFAAGIAAGNDISSVLRNATVGCMCGAMMFRGFRHLLSHQLRQMIATQQAEARPATQGATGSLE